MNKLPIERFERAVARYLVEGPRESLDVGGSRRWVLGRLAVSSTKDVAFVVRAAAACQGVKLHPVSCGKNWGFGSHLPPEEKVFLLDLSGLRTVRALDFSSHRVEVEAGVTQGDLDGALQKTGRTHYFNVTGAGLSTSILGNALEKGIGYFGSKAHDVLDLEVVLADGSITRTSRLKSRVAGRYATSLGPDPTGLFLQSGFGIVTAAWLPLLKRPEAMASIVLSLRDERNLEVFVKLVSEVMAERLIQSVPHILNKKRLLTTLGAFLNQAQFAELERTACSWNALIPLPGPLAVVEAIAKHLQDRFKTVADLSWNGPAQKQEGAERPELETRQRPWPCLQQLGLLSQGIPTGIALASVPFASNIPVTGSHENLEQLLDSGPAGLIHVTPLVPLVGTEVRELLDLAHERMRHHGVSELPMTLNAIDCRTAVLVIAVPFNRSDKSQSLKARKLANDLFSEFIRSGFLPYRTGIEEADLLPLLSSEWRRIFKGLHDLLDPLRILASSRYTPLWKPWRKSADRDKNGCAVTTIGTVGAVPRVARNGCGAKKLVHAS